MINDKQQELLESLQALAKQSGLDITDELGKITEKFENSEKAVAEVWERVEVARNSGRPRTLDYVNLIFDDFTELHGDRFFGDDPAMIGGMLVANGTWSGKGVFNMEDFDPEPFMQKLNIHGLPWTETFF